MFNILRNYLNFCFYLICCCVYVNIFLCIIIMFMSYNLFNYNFFMKVFSIVKLPYIFYSIFYLFIYC